MTPRTILCFISAVAGCAVPTQVVVHIDIDVEEQTRAETLRVRVWDTAGELALDRSTSAPNEATVPLLAQDDDGSRSYRLVAELMDVDGCVLARQVAVGGYQEGEARGVRLRFHSACADVACGRDQTCISGRCGEACFAGDDLDSEQLSRPVRCESTLDPRDEPGPVVSDMLLDEDGRVRWDVTPVSTGQLEYGESYTYGNLTSMETDLLPFHRQPVQLPPGAHHFRVYSTDMAGRQSISPEQCLVLPEL